MKKKYHFEVNDPVIINIKWGHHFNDISIKYGIIFQIDKHPTLSTMYRVNDNVGELIGRFYHHQLELNKELIRDFKIKQLGI